MSNGDYDIFIIGSGAGGGTLARHLAPSGKSILLLERGDWLKREAENWSAEEVFVRNRYVSGDTWRDKNGKPFQPGIHYFVGGATKMYGAALYRLRKEDFGELKHYDGVSPAWPIMPFRQSHTSRAFRNCPMTWRGPVDPRTSVLDTNCKAHGIDNLYVADASFFPSIGAVNPALTVMANALRVGDHLLARIR
jgi:choline dehydrogenase-like flavoprotein